MNQHQHKKIWNGQNGRRLIFVQYNHNRFIFNNLRNRSEKLNGSTCSECKYNIICGGCRGRAMAYSGDYMGDDPSCFIHDDNKE